MRMIVPALAAVLALGAIGPTALAQDAATGVVTGRVVDPSSAAVAGAKVVATRMATAVARETTTEATGAYVIASLAPGEYKVEVQAQGFAPFAVERVLVLVGRRATVDAVLSLEGRAESVVVEDRGVSVPTGNSLGSNTTS